MAAVDDEPESPQLFLKTLSTMKIEPPVQFDIWEKVFIEVEGPFPKTKYGHQYIVILTDSASKWIEAKALEERSPPSIATFVATTITRLGLCRLDFINFDPNFESAVRASIYATCAAFLDGTDLEYGLEELRNAGSEAIKDADEAEKRASFHTDKLLRWIGEHVESWDGELESRLFELRTASPGGGQQSPFALMHGGRLKSKNAPAASSTTAEKPRYPSRVRTSMRKAEQFTKESVDAAAAAKNGGKEDGVEVAAAAVSVAEPKKGRGRPRKSQTPMKIQLATPPPRVSKRQGSSNFIKATAAKESSRLPAKLEAKRARDARVQTHKPKAKVGKSVDLDPPKRISSNRLSLRSAKDIPTESVPDTLTCSKCTTRLSSDKEVLLHQTFHKDGSRLLHCMYCSQVAGTWEHMKDHFMQHVTIEPLPAATVPLQAVKVFKRENFSGSKPYRCSKCTHLKMATNEELEVHLSCHIEESKLLHCPHCPTVCGAWKQMQYHLGCHAEVPFEVYIVSLKNKTCFRCGKVFRNPETVHQHQMIYHKRDRRYQCETCGKTFKERKSIMRHQELHTDIIYGCNECVYKTRIRSDFIQHMRVHKGLGHACGICNKIFARQSQVALHMRCHNADRGVAICDQCGHQSNGRTALWNHVRNVHHTSKPWPCPQCQYVGKTKNNLRGHTERMHNKKFKCPQCDFGCMEECTMTKHMDLAHNDEERQFPCYHCSYRAKEAKCLAEHMRVFHNPNAKKYPCEFCELKFKTKSMLRDHMPQHTGQRFKCKHCGYIAKYRSVLYRHMKKRHPEFKFMPKGSRKMVETFFPLSATASGEGATVSDLDPTVTIEDDGQQQQQVGEGEDVTATSALVASEKDPMQDDMDAETIAQFNPSIFEGQSVIVDGNRIVLHASMFQQASDGSGAITLQIIPQDHNGEKMMMVHCERADCDEDDEQSGLHAKPIELMLVTSDEQHHS